MYDILIEEEIGGIDSKGNASNLSTSAADLVTEWQSIVFDEKGQGPIDRLGAKSAKRINTPYSCLTHFLLASRPQPREKLPMKSILREYSAHTALNLGQAARDLRFFYYHPAADERAADGTAKHIAVSLPLRARSLANNLLFSALPPHLHHTGKELKSMRQGSHAAWFLHGYMPWRFPLPKKFRR